MRFAEEYDEHDDGEEDGVNDENQDLLNYDDDGVLTAAGRTQRGSQSDQQMRQAIEPHRQETFISQMKIGIITGNL